MKKRVIFVILFACLTGCEEGVSVPTLTPVSPPVVFTFTPSSILSEKISEPELSSISMFDGERGWGVMDNRIGRTIDGGATWYLAMPENLDGNGTIASATFLDQNLAWFIWGDSIQDFEKGILFHTRDGGLTWDSSETPFNHGSMTFLDERNGWMMADLGAGAGSEAIAVYLTRDGGISWEQKFTNDPNREGSSNSVPLGGIKSGLVPLDEDTAFIWGVYYAPGSVYLYRTDNRGRNWQKVSLDLPEDAQDADLIVDRLQFVSTQDGFLLLNMVSDSLQQAVYKTRDGGDTWELTPKRLTPAGQANFLSPAEGIIYSNPSFYYTNDGAQTWQIAHPDISFGDMLISMDFLDLDNGWVIAYDESNTQILYRTIDGGRSWVPAIK